jgi:hypothetical protein
MTRTYDPIHRVSMAFERDGDSLLVLRLTRRPRD